MRTYLVGYQSHGIYRGIPQRLKPFESLEI